MKQIKRRTGGQKGGNKGRKKTEGQEVPSTQIQASKYQKGHASSPAPKR